MAGSIFTSFGAGDANATAFMTHLTAMTKGYNALSLTNMNNTTVPAIAAGSLIENNGALFKFDTETAISTTDPVTSATVADGLVYIMLVPSGSSISAVFTATAPTWSDSKQGWYGVGDYANNKYLAYNIVKSSASYTKRILIQEKSIFNYAASTSGNITTPNLNATSANVSILNMSTGAKHNGSFVAGYFDDGTPYYKKTVSGTVSSGTSLTISHGVSSGLSNIKSITFSSYWSSSSSIINIAPTSTVGGVTAASFGSSSISITVAAFPSGSVTVKCDITYI